MPEESSYNPYEHDPTITPDGRALDDTSYTLTANGIRCGRLVTLPKICLQTGVTEDLRSTQVWAESNARLWKVRLASLVAGIVSTTILVTSPFFLSGPYFPVIVTASGFCGVTGFVFAGFAWRGFCPRLTVNGFVTRTVRRSFLGGASLRLIAGLPLFIVVGTWALRIPLLPVAGAPFLELWMPWIRIAAALAFGKMLESVLKRHWKSNRNRGLELQATLCSDGVFEVTGFTNEFLNKLRSMHKENS